MPSNSPERSRGDLWAERMRARGCWVQKLPASSMAGLPDWIIGKIKTDVHQLGPRFVEAKTLEAVMSVRGKIPRNACTTAQQFFLDRWDTSGGMASVLILGEETFIELSWGSVDEPITRRFFDELARRYDER